MERVRYEGRVRMSARRSILVIFDAFARLGH